MLCAIGHYLYCRGRNTNDCLHLHLHLRFQRFRFHIHLSLRHENDSDMTNVENRSQFFSLFRSVKIREEIGETSEPFVCARPEGPNSNVLRRRPCAVLEIRGIRWKNKARQHNIKAFRLCVRRNKAWWSLCPWHTDQKLVSEIGTRKPVPETNYCENKTK